MTQALQEHRRRLAERGIKRVEVSVSEADADLIRRVAKALGKDDKTSDRVRTVIQGLVPDKVPVKFKEWLAASSDQDEH
jgi:uncharacterized Fe-S cluster-containing radical SAM superfamily enzyme